MENTSPSASEYNVSEKQHDHDARLSRLEAIVEGLAADVRGLANSVNDYVRNSGKTNWGWLLSAFVALGGFIYLHTNPINAQSQSNATAIANIHKQQVADAYSKGRNERDIAENSHELDLVWQELFDMMDENATLRTEIEWIKKESP